MKRIIITTEDLSLFRAARQKERPDWWAVFTAEPGGEVYPFVTRGRTRTSQRLYLRDDFPKLAEIADIYLEQRPSGGRFFINRSGAFFHEAENGPYDQFVEFLIRDAIVYAPPSATKG
jgi:hypothetical protein